MDHIAAVGKHHIKKAELKAQTMITYTRDMPKVHEETNAAEESLERSKTKTQRLMRECDEGQKASAYLLSSLGSCGWRLLLFQ